MQNIVVIDSKMIVELLFVMDFVRILAMDFRIACVEFATASFESIWLAITTFLFILPDKLIVESCF